MKAVKFITEASLWHFNITLSQPARESKCCKMSRKTAQRARPRGRMAE